MMAQLGRLRDIQRVNAQDWMGADGSWGGECNPPDVDFHMEPGKFQSI